MKPMDAEGLIKYIARCEQERGGDAFLYPPKFRPGPFVYTNELFEYIEVQAGITKEEAGAIYRAAKV